MDSKDESNNFKRISDLPVNNRRQQPKLLHLSNHWRSLTSTEKRSQFIRQKRIYESVDNSDCNRPNVDSAEDQSYTINRTISGNQMNLIN